MSICIVDRPLKGGKHSNWQGGVRVNSFLSGGALPQPVRGTKSNELISKYTQAIPATS